MIRPRKFDNVADAVRWATYGGVALYTGSEAYEGAALYAAPTQSSEAVGWARWWAGKAGATFAEIVNRGTYAESCVLNREQTATLAAQCVDGPQAVGSVPTTVVFFTGTRDGCTTDQLDGLREWLFNRNILSAHHGCCIGADAEFHGIAEGLRLPGHKVPWLVGWPAEVPPDLTAVERLKCDDLHLKQAPLTRNKQMAEYARWYANHAKNGEQVACVACPREDEPPATGRGGTWHAVRMFKNCGIPVSIITPTGSIRNE